MTILQWRTCYKTSVDRMRGRTHYNLVRKIMVDQYEWWIESRSLASDMAMRACDNSGNRAKRRRLWEQNYVSNPRPYHPSVFSTLVFHLPMATCFTIFVSRHQHNELQEPWVPKMGSILFNVTIPNCTGIRARDSLLWGQAHFGVFSSHFDQETMLLAELQR